MSSWLKSWGDMSLSKVIQMLLPLLIFPFPFSFSSVTMCMINRAAQKPLRIAFASTEDHEMTVWNGTCVVY